jgi:uncharacterized YokU family protein
MRNGENGMKCLWCESEKAGPTGLTGYWELPDGSRAIEITMIPSVSCGSCGMEYQEDHIVDEIEDQLMLIDTKNIESSIVYSELMSVPRLLKKNYFKM